MFLLVFSPVEFRTLMEFLQYAVNMHNLMYIKCQPLNLWSLTKAKSIVFFSSFVALLAPSLSRIKLWD